VFWDVTVRQATGKGYLIIPLMYVFVTTMKSSAVMGYTYFPKLFYAIFKYFFAVGRVPLLYDLQ
jgi:hypothetical protein